jgi:hypothetical protein
MDDSVKIRMAYNPKTNQYDLCECDKCGAYVLPQSYIRHIKTKKHLEAGKFPPKKEQEVVEKKAPFKIETGSFSVRF